MFNVLQQTSTRAKHIPIALRRVFALTLTLALLFSMTQLSPIAHAAPTDVTWPIVRIQTLASGFDNPVNLLSAKDGTGRLFVVERGGKIYIVENGERVETPFLDIADRVTNPDSCGECGLLGLAFPTNFAEDGYFFVNYTSNANRVPGETGDRDGNYDTVIARFLVTDNPNVADPDSEETILEINQPESNHNGGHIVFGLDDYLYIGMGDGGGGNDPNNNAQDPASPHGKMLRIEVGATGTYTVPADNPFIDTEGYLDEIWAMGLRNPWRFNFDPITGDLYIADVGQGSQEEVSYIAADDLGNGGMNFGWPIFEGKTCHLPAVAGDCQRTDLVPPVIQYDHSEGDCSITGGFVYRSPMPFQAPIYLYGDFCSGVVRGAQPEGEIWQTNILQDYDFMITSFGEDEDGSLYVVSYAGTVYQILGPDNASYIPSLSKAITGTSD